MEQSSWRKRRQPSPRNIVTVQAIRERTGSKECWEVEAIDPEFLQNQVHDAVLSVLDVEQLNAVQQRKRSSKRKSLPYVAGWG